MTLILSLSNFQVIENLAYLRNMNKLKLYQYLKLILIDERTPIGLNFMTKAKFKKET